MFALHVAYVQIYGFTYSP